MLSNFSKTGTAFEKKAAGTIRVLPMTYQGRGKTPTLQHSQSDRWLKNGRECHEIYHRHHQAFQA